MQHPITNLIWQFRVILSGETGIVRGDGVVNHLSLGNLFAKQDDPLMTAKFPNKTGGTDGTILGHNDDVPAVIQCSEVLLGIRLRIIQLFG